MAGSGGADPVAAPALAAGELLADSLPSGGEGDVDNAGFISAIIGIRPGHTGDRDSEVAAADVPAVLRHRAGHRLRHRAKFVQKSLGYS